jgi:serine/threonine protein phosphatase PrpC
MNWTVGVIIAGSVQEHKSDLGSMESTCYNRAGGKMQQESPSDDGVLEGKDIEVPVGGAASEVGQTEWQTADSGVLTLTFAWQSDPGRVRSHNEDAVDVVIPTESRELARKGVLCLVADGMGGHRAGEVASKRAVEVVHERYYADGSTNLTASLAGAFRAANRDIYTRAQLDESRIGMGTTLVGAVILGDRVYIANVGDSRAYIAGREGFAQITDDHSWVEEQVRAGLLAPDQARGHPRRNLVTRALGTKPGVDVDLFEGALAPGDNLLLCSDGLTNLLEDREIEVILRERTPQEAVPLLVEAANERGGQDNITVVLVAAATRGVVGGRRKRAIWMGWSQWMQRLRRP